MLSFGAAASAPLVSALDGSLVSVRVSVDPRRLESLLDCLAGLSFPVNPELFHGVPTVVEFPAYENKVAEVRSALRACGFDPGQAEVTRMLERLTD